MGILQEAFEKEIAKLPNAMLLKMVSAKLAALGLNQPELATKITDHILNRRDGILEWQSDDTPGIKSDVPTEIKLTFDDDDLRQIDEKVEHLTANLPDIVEGFTKKVGHDLLANFRDQWAEAVPKETDEIGRFRARLQDRWGDGLGGLRLLLELSRDLGSEFHERHLRSKLKANHARNEALFRLHLRALQITSEILTLMENGYPDGASARWRTLFEVSTVATLIADGGDPVAERYLAHTIIDRKKMLNEYQDRASEPGGSAVPAREAKAITKEYEAALRKFGKPFRETNGWAAGHFGLQTNPTFAHLQEAAGRAAMRAEYRLASFGIHAGPSAFERKFLSFYESLQIAGATNAGLEEPGINTANCLMQITALMIGEPWDIDRLAHMQALLRLRVEICSAFEAAARQLERDEQKGLKRAIRDSSRRAAKRKINALR